MIIRNNTFKKLLPFRGRSIQAVAIAAILLMPASCATNQQAREMANMHLTSGIASIESGEYTSALRELFEAQRLNPDNPQTHYYLGIAYYRRGLREDCSRAFTRAIELKPDYSEAYNYLGLIRFEDGNYEESIELFKKALKNVLYETPELALFNIGRAYREMRFPDKALSYFQDAQRVRPNKILPLIHVNMGTLLLTLNRPDDALFYLKESVRQAPYAPDFRYALGEAFLAKGMRKEAAREFRQTVELDPESEPAAKARRHLASMPPP